MMIVGVGVTMDNMLYIIAGLVLILLVAVLVLRKNKAQNPPEQRPIQTGRNAAANAPISTHNEDRHSTAQRDPSSVNKFDNTAIAQRFMDQQRYDKAIETLDRGLIEKPNDNQLLLKLLSVYAATDQLDDFYRVYDAIKTHSDAETINQADELKALLVGEQDQEVPPVVTEADNNSDNFDSLDFDLPTAQTVSEKSNEDRVLIRLLLRLAPVQRRLRLPNEQNPFLISTTPALLTITWITLLSLPLVT